MNKTKSYVYTSVYSDSYLEFAVQFWPPHIVNEIAKLKTA